MVMSPVSRGLVDMSGHLTREESRSNPLDRTSIARHWIQDLEKSQLNWRLYQRHNMHYFNRIRHQMVQSGKLQMYSGISTACRVWKILWTRPPLTCRCKRKILWKISDFIWIIDQSSIVSKVLEERQVWNKHELRATGKATSRIIECSGEG